MSKQNHQYKIMNDLMNIKVVSGLSSYPNEKHDTFELRIFSHPFSRNLVTAICAKYSIDFNYVKECKNRETFKIFASPQYEASFKKAIDLVNFEARRLKDEGHYKKFTEIRNDIVSQFISLICVKENSDFQKINPNNKTGRKAKLLT